MAIPISNSKIVKLYDIGVIFNEIKKFKKPNGLSHFKT
jgi:hypothetical protein